MVPDPLLLMPEGRLVYRMNDNMHDSLGTGAVSNYTLEKEVVDVILTVQHVTFDML